MIFPNVPEAFFSISDFLFNASHALRWPVFALLIIAALLGAPLFVIIGGIGVLLFSQSGGSLEVIPGEAYSMLISPSIPAIPLFTLTGFILSESGAGKRLVRLFRAFFGWLPGGLTIATVIVCAFFTTFTGASGVTILALGALLSYVLIENGYKQKFSHGLLTGSGSIGLLFPPSLPIILYGVVAQTNIMHIYLGGIIPGAIMVVTLSAMGVYSAIKNKLPRTPFKVKEAVEATAQSAGEVLLPVIIIVGYFTGIMTIVESAAVSVLYTIVIEVFIHRDIKVRELPKTALKAVPIIGGVLIILTVARGLSYYIVDAEVPFRMSAWVEQHISSKYVFLILLNLVLLATGCLMDIFSAIVVVAPLIIPLGEIFGIHPVHLGIIFLANLELGYLTPPIGLNLFLASYRFEEPLVKVYKNVIPFFIVLLITVLLITYVPWFSTVLVPPG
jgi:tripartite ATP-independent transporter DctM subunit